MDAQPPQKQAGNQEDRREQREKRVAEGIDPSGQVEQRVILAQRERNHEGTEAQNSVAVDRERIRAELTAAVREDVHEFQTFRREEADRCVDDEQSREDDRAAEDHQDERQDLIPCPHDAAGRDDD